MLKKEITYTDYDDVKRTEVFMFNLSKAEIMELELGMKGGLSSIITQLIKTNDTPKIVALFKEVILKAYGEKSADGKRFIKINDDGISLSNRFAQTAAYSVLYMELSTNDEAAAEFIKGIMPKGVEVDTKNIPEIPQEVLASVSE